MSEQILFPLILCIESKLINTDKIIKCLNTAELQFSVFSAMAQPQMAHRMCICGLAMAGAWL